MGVRELRPKEEHFAQCVASGLSYAAAYRTAYDVKPGASSRYSDACEIKARPPVARRIFELQKQVAAKVEVKRADLVRWHIARMAYNPDELIKTVASACRHCHGDDFGYQWRAHDYMRELAEAEQANGKIPLPDIAGGFGYNATRPPHPDCPNCDGVGLSRTVVTPASELSGAARAAYEGVKETQHGIEVKMADKLASSQEVAKLLGFYVERNAIDLDEEVPDTDLGTLDMAGLNEYYRTLIGKARRLSRG